MDEPLGALDAEFRELMCDELRACTTGCSATTVYVTHDQIEAMAMADTIAIMNQGVIEQLGAPQEVYDRPAQRVRRRLHRRAGDELPAASRRRCAAAHRACAIGGARVAGAGAARGRRPAARCCCGVRPEHVRFDDDSALRAEVLGTEYLGTSQIVTVTTAHGATLRAQGRRRDVPARRGDQRRPGVRRRRSSRCSTRPAGARALRSAACASAEARHG